MYESFFGFAEKPFNITPDPRFLYLSEKHREALAQLIYGVKEKKGFVVLSGDVGTGKTTIVRALLERLDENCQVAYIFNTRLSIVDFLKYVCHDFGLEVTSDSKIDYLIKLHDFLIESHNDGKTTTLIVDEAQNLDASLFEEIRMLTNLETSNHKLFQIFLVGQPELNELLDQPDLWQLKQRISSRYHLLPLDRDETKGYIHTRMRIAGAKRLNCFTEGAIQKIYEHSQGIPRLINNICDNALLLGYANDSPIINEKTVRECVADLKLDEMPKSRKRKSKPKKERETEAGLGIRPFRYAVLATIVALVAVGLALLFLNHSSVHGIISKPLAIIQPGSEQPDESGAADTMALSEQDTDQSQDTQTASLAPEEDVPAVGAYIEETAPENEKPIASHTETRTKENPEGTDPIADLTTRTVVAQEGDTISHIVFREFGRVDAHLLDVVQKLNPEIDDIDEILAGQEVRLPVTPEEAYKNPGNPGCFSSHVASFRNFDEARRLCEEFIRSGENSTIVAAKVHNTGPWYRVTIGEYKTLAEASLETDKLVRNGYFTYAKPLKLPALKGATNKNEG